MRVPKAYKNEEFLASEEARSLRILAEYLEPKRRLAAEKVTRGIVFFGSARQRQFPDNTIDPYQCAADLAERLARWTLATHPEGSRYHLVTGGGDGMMGAVNEGVARVDRRLNVGLGISLPFEQGLNENLDPSRAFEFHYFFMRKFWFMNLSDAFVILPGGFGTLDELFEVLTLTQTGRASKKPIVLLDSGFWRTIINFRALATRGLINPDDLHLFHYAESAEQAFDILTRALP